MEMAVDVDVSILNAVKYGNRPNIEDTIFRR